MPIVHDLIIRMQGTIELNSILGKGTEFTVMLPLANCTGGTAAREKET